MKLSKILSAGLLVLSVGSFAGAAHADPVTWTITGTVQSVYDQTGILASNGVSVNPGDSATFTWTFDTASTGSYAYSYDCGGCTYSYAYSYNYGGGLNAHFGGLTAAASGDVQSYDYSNQYLSSGYSYSQNYDEPYANFFGGPGYGGSSGSLSSNAPDPAAGSAYAVQSVLYAWFGNFSYDPNAFYPSDTSFAHFDRSNYSTQYMRFQYYSYDSNWNQLSALNVYASITDVQRSDVPAPGALALLGLGLIGLGTMRRRSTKSV